MNNLKLVDDLKLGDFVPIKDLIGKGPQYRIMRRVEVTRLTATMIICGKLRFSKKDGAMLPRSQDNKSYRLLLKF